MFSLFLFLVFLESHFVLTLLHFPSPVVSLTDGAPHSETLSFDDEFTPTSIACGEPGAFRRYTVRQAGSEAFQIKATFVTDVSSSDCPTTVSMNCVATSLSANIDDTNIADTASEVVEYANTVSCTHYDSGTTDTLWEILLCFTRSASSFCPEDYQYEMLAESITHSSLYWTSNGVVYFFIASMSALLLSLPSALFLVLYSIRYCCCAPKSFWERHLNSDSSDTPLKQKNEGDGMVAEIRVDTRVKKVGEPSHSFGLSREVEGSDISSSSGKERVVGWLSRCWNLKNPWSVKQLCFVLLPLFGCFSLTFVAFLALLGSFAAYSIAFLYEYEVL